MAGPSFTNSWPSPFPHFPQCTWNNTSHIWIRILCIPTESAFQALNKSFTSLLRVVYLHLVTYSRWYTVVYTECTSMKLSKYSKVNLFSTACTLYAPGLSGCFDTLSSWTVSVKAGQGDECSYLERLEKSW